MANIRTGSIISDIRGRVGDEVYSRNRGGAYVKSYAGARGAAVGRQVDWESAFTDAMNEWKNPTELPREDWIAEAERLNRVNGYFGSRKLTGRQLFLSRTIRNIALGGFIPDRTITPFPDVEFSAEIINATGTTLEIASSVSTPLSVTTAWGMFSDQLPSTINSFNTVWKYAYIRAVMNPNPPSFDIYSDWNSFWGSGPLVAGNRIFAKYFWIDVLSGVIKSAPPQIFTIT